MAARAFREMPRRVLVGRPLEMCGSTISNTTPVPVDDAYPYPHPTRAETFYPDYIGTVGDYHNLTSVAKAHPTRGLPYPYH